MKKILQFPLTRIIIGLFLVALTFNGSLYLINYLTGNTSNDLIKLLNTFMATAIGVFAYSLLFRYYESRKIEELTGSGWGKNIGLGLLLGFVLQSLTILTIYFFGEFSIISFNGLMFMVPALGMALSSAIIEEILLRGIIFRIMEEKLGSYIALGVSALLFGLMHLGNPNSSIIDAIGLAIQAGLLLAVAYMYTRNLWFPISIHFAWNFTQSGIFGANVSGITLDKSLLTTNIEGSKWLTGGEFGPEGSIQATLFCLIATTGLFIFALKQNRIIPPFWKK